MIKRILFSAIVGSACFQSYGQCTTVFVAPFSENFDSSPTWTRASTDCFYPTVFQRGNIDPCWQRSNNSSTNSDHVFVGGPIIDGGCGTLAPFTMTGNGLYVRPYQYGLPTNSPAYLTSPKIDISNLSYPEIEIWHNLMGTINSLYIQAKEANSSSWANLDTITRGGVFYDSIWKSNYTPIAGLSSDTIQLRFMVNEVQGSTVAFDNFRIIDGSPCARVSNVHVVATTDTSITLDWSGGTSNWQIEYGPGINYQGFGSYSVLNINSKPFTVTGLSPYTKYTFYVRDTCGASNPSHWSHPLFHRTECSPVMAPFLENFDGPNFAPNFGQPEQFDSCYARFTNSSNYQWHVYDSLSALSFLNTGAAVDHTSGNGKYLSTSGLGSSATADLYTPLINVSSLQSPVLTFWLYMYGADIKGFEVSAVGDGFSVKLDSVTSQLQTSNNDPWFRVDVSLANLPSSIFKLKFTGKGKPNAYISSSVCIDDIHVYEASCVGPISISIDSTTTSSARVSWIDSSSSNWNIEYGLKNFAQGQGILDSQITSKFYTFSGLTPGTTYEYYLQGFCGTLDSSAVKGPFSFATDCDSLYAGFTDSTGILDVSLDASSSLGSNVSYHWSFGDGTGGVGKKASHTYSNAGAYSITLVAQDTCYQIEIVQRTIDVCDSLKAAFTYMINDTVVTFMAQNNTGITQYYWDFGDGNQGSGAVVQHAYNLASSSRPFQVKLKVMNSCGQQDSVMETMPADIDIHEHVLKDVLIYPNPSSSEVFVILPELSAQEATIILFDSSGQRFEPDFKKSSNTIRIDLSEVVSGRYLLQLKLEQREYSKKILVEK